MDWVSAHWAGPMLKATDKLKAQKVQGMPPYKACPLSPPASSLIQAQVTETAPPVSRANQAALQMQEKFGGTVHLSGVTELAPGSQALLEQRKFEEKQNSQILALQDQVNNLMNFVQSQARDSARQQTEQAVVTPVPGDTDNMSVDQRYKRPCASQSVEKQEEVKLETPKVKTETPSLSPRSSTVMSSSNAGWTHIGVPSWPSPPVTPRKEMQLKSPTKLSEFPEDVMTAQIAASRSSASTIPPAMPS